MKKIVFTNDLPAGFVVFLVALPLCLGIALASGAPLMAGIISGIVGGIVAGALSGSSLSVSGPAAGLTTVVLTGIHGLGSYPAFVFCVLVAGVFQIALGFLRAGSVGHFFPAAVIRGMLAAIGLILILKQIPHAVGFDSDFEGDERFAQDDGLNTFSEILESLSHISPGAIVISVCSVLILILWDTEYVKRNRFLALVPSPLLVVMAGILLNYLFYADETFAIQSRHMVHVPSLRVAADEFQLPDFSQWRNPMIYTTAAMIAAVASLETLLNIEASDAFDPHRRITPLNRELKAQGVANVVAGLLGGLPITSVIVRSSTNISAGARTNAATITHGVILLLTVVCIPHVLEKIPLACLAGLLLVVGYKLTRPAIYGELWRKGIAQFLPFICTVVCILLTDLLAGIFCGMLVSVFFILRTNFQKTVIVVSDENRYLLSFTKDVSFLTKATLRDAFYKIPPGADLRIDGTKANFMDHDIRETIRDFLILAPTKNIRVELKNVKL